MDESNPEETTLLSVIPEKKKLQTLKHFVLLFLFYAFIGWLLETAYAYYVFGHFVKRGFLLGPICPIYGCGAVILVTFLEKDKKHPLKLFLLAGIIFSVFEYIAGFTLDALFAARWWDYTNEFMNLNGRISIFFSFVWGFIALFFFHFIDPVVNKLFDYLAKKIPSLLQNICFYIFLITFMIDVAISAIKHLSM